MSEQRRQNELSMDGAITIYRQFWALSVIDSDKIGGLCYCCDNPPTGRSSANVWGTIVDFPSCDTCHKRKNETWTDSVEPAARLRVA